MKLRPLLKKNKKGFVGDIGIVLAFLFAFALIVVVGWKVFDAYNQRYQTTEANQEAKDLVQQNASRYVSLFDAMFLFVLFGLAVSLFVSTSYIDTRPEFFFITVIAAIIFVGLAAVISNAFEQASNDPGLADSTNDFSKIPEIMYRLPVITLVLIAATLMGLYFKSRSVF